jgi:hypothetical protein
LDNLGENTVEDKIKAAIEEMAVKAKDSVCDTAVQYSHAILNLCNALNTLKFVNRE